MYALMHIVRTELLRKRMAVLG